MLVLAGCGAEETFTIYPVMCEGSATTKRCPAPTPLNRSRYRALVDRQEVLEWSPGVSEIPYRLTKCAVRSSTNWMCSDSASGRAIRVEEGKFSERWDSVPERTDFVYVSRIRWWLLHLGFSTTLGHDLKS